MRIAIFSDTFPPQTNGVANTVWQSAENLVALGHQVAIFTVSKNGKPENETNANLQVYFLPSVPALVYPDERITAPVGNAYPRLKKFAPDIIHTHTPFTVGWEALLCAKLLKVPVVGTHHTFYDHYLRHVKLDYKWGRKIAWKITIGYYNLCDLIISPSQSLCDSLLREGIRKPVEILVNSVDTVRFSPVPDQTAKKRLKEKYNIPGQSLFFVGRLSYEKSIDVVLKAFSLILKKKPEPRMMIIGGGPEKPKLEGLARGLGIQNSVIFTGPLYGDDLVDALRANDLYISACKNENMPLAVLEIMACGLPAIVVKEMGLAEIVKENVSGLFAQTDDPKDLAQKTLNLLNNPDLLEKFGQASRQLSLQYSHEKIGKSLEQIYKKLINK